MTDLEAHGVGDAPPPYMIFLVVFLFFITGLLGFLICHLLKKKGYSCRTADDEEEEEKLGGSEDNEDEENQDTVEQILKCIIENEANMEAFNELLGGRNVCVRHDPRLRKESIAGIPPHHHTVHSGMEHNTCHLCAQSRSKKGRRQSRTPRFKQRPGEQTVFSVGRFRVIHTDKKLQGSSNALAASSDQLDQSQDSEDRKDAGYNLRNMFKDVNPPSENSNGTAVNVGKRRKSLTIFGMRRGSDPAGVKLPEGTGRETGGLKFGIQQQPAVLEEPLQTKSVKDTPESGTKPAPTPGTETTKTVPKDGSKNGPRTVNPSDGVTASPAPSSLLIPSSASSEQTLKRTEKQEDVEYNILRNDDPGPVQTSTPIAPGPGFTPVVSSGQPEPSLAKGFPVTQTPLDATSSPNQEAALVDRLDLISISSSPPSSIPIKTLSSASSLKTPTSPSALTQSPKPSPKPSLKNTPSDAATAAFSPTLTPSPKLPSGRAIASPLQAQTPSPRLSDSPKLSARGDMVSIPLPLKEQKPEEAIIPKSEGTPEIKLRGILKKGKLSPPAGDSALSSPPSKDKLSSLPVSPSSPLSPSSPRGSRISSVTIVKASPDSKREFSVVTMVDKEEQSTSQQSQMGETSEFGVGSGKEGAVGQPARQTEETSGAEVRSMASQEKDDMVEMEDIRDCKVMQVEEAERVEEEAEKTVSVQSKPD